jgi:outer membrane protein assembly factor BamB
MPSRRKFLQSTGLTLPGVAAAGSVDTATAIQSDEYERGEEVWRFTEISNPEFATDDDRELIVISDEEVTAPVYALDSKTGDTIWEFSLPENDIVVDSCTAIDQSVYAFDRERGTIIAISIETGELRWIFNEPNNEIRFPEYGWEEEENWTIVRVRDQPEMYGVNMENGESWRESGFGGILNITPTRSDGVVYQPVHGDDTLYAIDSTTGDTLWTFSPPDGIPDEVIFTDIENGTMYIGFNSLYAIDIETGEQEWRYQPSDGNIDTIELGTDNIYVTIRGSIGSRELKALDWETRAEQWSYTGSEDTEINLDVQTRNDSEQVFVGTFDGELSKIDPDTGEEMWVYTDLSGYVNANYVRNDIMIYVDDNTNTPKIVAIDTIQGESLWTFDEFDGEPSHPDRSEGFVLNTTEAGSFYVFDEKTGEIVVQQSTNSTEADVWDPTLITNRFLFDVQNPGAVIALYAGVSEYVSGQARRQQSGENEPNTTPQGTPARSDVSVFERFSDDSTLPLGLAGGGLLAGLGIGVYRWLNETEDGTSETVK